MLFPRVHGLDAQTREWLTGDDGSPGIPSDDARARRAILVSRDAPKCPEMPCVTPCWGRTRRLR
jgi:hypothetical protein